eukprot:gene6996-8127_t
MQDMPKVIPKVYDEKCVHCCNSVRDSSVHIFFDALSALSLCLKKPWPRWVTSPPKQNFTQYLRKDGDNNQFGGFNNQTLNIPNRINTMMDNAKNAAEAKEFEVSADLTEEELEAILAEEDTPEEVAAAHQETDVLEGYEDARPNEREVPLRKRVTNAATLPYHHTSKEIEQMLRSHLKKFLVKVHPDVFHGDVDKRATNQKSLTTLNNLLRTRDQYIRVAEGVSDETKLDKIPSVLPVAFHHHTSDGIALVEQELLFEEPAADVATSKAALVAYVTELRFAVHRQLYELFRKTDISIPEFEIEKLTNPPAVSADVFDDPWEEFFNATPTDSLANVLDDFIARNNVSEGRAKSETSLEHESLLQLFNEDKVFFYYGEEAKGDINVMRSLGLRDEAERQILHIKRSLLALEFRDWHQLPIIVTLPSFEDKVAAMTANSGFVVLTKDFDPSKVLPYIKQRIPKISKTFGDLYSISRSNMDILERSTVQLEKSLGASSVIIENLFSVNQRTMKKVRDVFNKSQATISELNIPMIKLIESTRAERWESLPITKFDDVVIDSWRLRNVELSEQERTKLEAKIKKAQIEAGRASEASAIAAASSQLPSDIRESPLTIVDTNQFNHMQSAPYVVTAMSCIERLTKLVNEPVTVSMVMPERNTSEEIDTQEEERMLFTDTKKTVEILTNRPNIVPLDLNLNTNAKAATVSSFGMPTFGSANVDLGQKQANDKVASMFEGSSVSKAVNAITENEEQEQEQEQVVEAPKTPTIVHAQQRLTDFGWANINLVISDHYQFIMSKDEDLAYVFIPINFKEEELMLFLNANYDSIALIQNIFYSPVMQETQLVLQVQAIESVIRSTIERGLFASIKIDNDALPLRFDQHEVVTHFKNVVSLSTDIESIRKIGPHTNIVIGKRPFEISFEDDAKSRVTIYLDARNKSTMNMQNIIKELCEQSTFFNELLPERNQSFAFSLFNIPAVSESNNITPKDQ